jgi:hypothetical protein
LLPAENLYLLYKNKLKQNCCDILFILQKSNKKIKSSCFIK